MKLFRFGSPAVERPGILVEGRGPLDASAFGEDYDGAFFESGGPARLRSFYAENAASCPLLSPDQRLGPVVKSPSKIVCVGLNYQGHARETGARIPTEPVLFLKAPSAVSGAFDPVLMPKGAEKLDWEVELAVVIKSRTSYVSRDRALEHVAGYTLMNDYSERAFQKERGGQFTKGKSSDTFAPLGPHLVTADAFDPSEVGLWLRVNGELRQDGNTRDLIFDVPTLVSYISEFMTLLPGDVISTGTPAGVGLGRKPPTFLREGDVVEYGADGLGSARQIMARRATADGLS